MCLGTDDGVLRGERKDALAGHPRGIEECIQVDIAGSFSHSPRLSLSIASLSESGRQGMHGSIHCRPCGQWPTKHARKPATGRPILPGDKTGMGASFNKVELLCGSNICK